MSNQINCITIKGYWCYDTKNVLDVPFFMIINDEINFDDHFDDVDER